MSASTAELGSVNVICFARWNHWLFHNPVLIIIAQQSNSNTSQPPLPSQPYIYVQLQCTCCTCTPVHILTMSCIVIYYRYMYMYIYIYTYPRQSSERIIVSAGYLYIPPLSTVLLLQSLIHCREQQQTTKKKWSETGLRSPCKATPSLWRLATYM